MTQYDSGILQNYADALYRKAAWVTLKCAAIGGVVVAVLTGVACYAVSSSVQSRGVPAGADNSSTAAVLVVLGGVLGALIGVAVGQRRAFEYRLQAQTVLCQLNIEYNTRQKPTP
jgi:uncharacterized integral membrane protein